MLPLKHPNQPEGKGRESEVSKGLDIPFALGKENDRASTRIGKGINGADVGCSDAGFLACQPISPVSGWVTR